MLFFALAFVLLGFTGRDDSHITYFVSDMIAGGAGVVNYNGAPIEQSSSLLFSAVLAIVVYLSGAISATAGPLLSIFWLGACMVYGAIMLHRLQKDGLPLVAFLSLPAVYWSLSGMENSFYLFLVLVFLDASRRLHSTIHEGTNVGSTGLLPGHFLIALSTFALTLSRPEFPFVFALAVCILAVLRAKNLALVKHLAIAGTIGDIIAIWP